MSRTLFTSKGAAVDVGRELGRGGEGSVFEVPARATQVAKLYHKALDTRKQSKLRYMVSTADTRLLDYVAWPQETLHSTRGGAVTGFLMPRVSERDPIHMVYGPAHRRQDYPKAAWDFLLFVARNVSASFETVHAHGHVIGDVNENSVMVGHDSKVVLIDSDSFQVDAQGTVHHCEVGVPYFTAPELLVLPSFDGVTRTTNHDNFALALLIFHLLFGGRHPYAGVPLRNGVGDELKADIKNFRYAYARDNRARGFSPPPLCIPVSILPNALQYMFQLAFTEEGASGSRPTATQWVAALDGLRGTLKKCNASAIHVYPDHLSSCPWCTLEQQGVVYFVSLGSTFTPAPGDFVLVRAWGLIQAVPMPAPLSLPAPKDFNVIAKVLPESIPNEGTVTVYRLVAVAIAMVIMVAAPGVWLLGLLVGWAGWAMAGSTGSYERGKERSIRQNALDVAKREYDALVERARAEAGPEGFHARRSHLLQMKEELERGPRAEQEELAQLDATAQERQKRKYLDTCFIDRANIPGVGQARKAVLRSFGIETAADVTNRRVRQVRGFGEALTGAMLDWRRSCEQQFKFNPATAVSKGDRDAVRAKFAAQRVALERTLTAAPDELRRFRQLTTTRLAALTPRLEDAARKLAQAQADLALL